MRDALGFIPFPIWPLLCRYDRIVQTTAPCWVPITFAHHLYISMVTSPIEFILWIKFWDLISFLLNVIYYCPIPHWCSVDICVTLLAVSLTPKSWHCVQCQWFQQESVHHTITRTLLLKRNSNFPLVEPDPNLHHPTSSSAPCTTATPRKTSFHGFNSGFTDSSLQWKKPFAPEVLLLLVIYVFEMVWSR